MNAEVELTIMPPSGELPLLTATVLSEPLTQWTVKQPLPTAFQHHQNPLHLAAALEEANISVRWHTATSVNPECVPAACGVTPLFQGGQGGSKVLDRGIPPEKPAQFTWLTNPTILALIPHWRCEPWLTRCLTSLCQQTHPLTNIVVIDDASPTPPLEIIRQFPQVTLLQAPDRVGPYRLIQSVINRTTYDAYLCQDADDWSSCDRLATLLQTAHTTGAELVGSQEIRVLEPDAQVQAVGYPLDVNQSLAQAPGHALLHPTSLITRSLIQRLGGFATGLRFGGDTEFLLRAHWCARIVNSPRSCYFRRKRPESLTTAAETGLASPIRQALTQTMKDRAIANAQAATQGQTLDLNPLATAPDIPLQHLWGPELQWI
ncbi:MAG: glycosyltransferase [Spirulina sp. SIO3F2]|nr:glycosyltransferase [Spirulina sp. SIO3F2]